MSINEMEYHTIEHTFEPVYDEHSRILILGSLPSVKSRINNFYYGHPQNRFWRVLWMVFAMGSPSGVSNVEYPIDSFTIEEKKEFLYKNKIAIWDVIAKCDIIGSSDSTIRNVIPNNIDLVLRGAKIEKIYVNGNKAYELYMKHCYNLTGREAVKLPSTSPANAAYSLEKLTQKWKVISL